MILFDFKDQADQVVVFHSLFAGVPSRSVYDRVLAQLVVSHGRAHVQDGPVVVGVFELGARLRVLLCSALFQQADQLVHTQKDHGRDKQIA